MKKNKVVLRTHEIRKVLQNYKPIDAIIEYIWNGFGGINIMDYVED